MKRRIILPLSLMLLLCACDGGSQSGYVYNGMRYTSTESSTETTSSETTETTTVTTLKPFAEFTTMPKMTFRQISRLNMNGRLGEQTVHRWSKTETEEITTEETETEWETTIKTYRYRYTDND